MVLMHAKWIIVSCVLICVNLDCAVSFDQCEKEDKCSAGSDTDWSSLDGKYSKSTCNGRIIPPDQDH